MIGFRLEQAKALFFDRQAIERPVGALSVQVLRKTGGTTRKIARRSMRPASKTALMNVQKKRMELAKARNQHLKARLRAELIALQRAAASKPGQPPKAITRLIRDKVVFVYDPATRSMVAGPVWLNQKVTDAPHALEYGGPSRIFVGRKSRRRHVRTVQIRERPFMRPAFGAAQQELPALLTNSVRP